MNNIRILIRKYLFEIYESQNKKYNIIYLYGLDGNIKNEDIDCLTNANIITPHINYRKENVFDKISDIIKKEKPDAIIGHSLGGYIAYFLSKKYNIPCLIFNPSFDKSDIDLQPIKNKNSFQDNKNIICVIGTKDDFINKDEQDKCLKKYKIDIKNEKIGHDIPRNIKEKYYKQLIKMLKNIT